MLSQEDNEALCRIGPGTPMGNLFRQYWLPGAEVGRAAGAGLPAGARQAAGRGADRLPHDLRRRVGLIQNACPHRGASMFFGRNEEEGLRCVYHGWKFDVAGNCVDMPSEPAESNFKTKVHATAYRTHERNGIIWAYMGTREVPPPLPELEANMLGEEETTDHASCTAPTTGCRAGRARWTPSTPPSCTAAPRASRTPSRARCSTTR